MDDGSMPDEGGPGGAVAFDPVIARQTLEQAGSSANFRHSPRQLALLSYLVEAECRGEGDRINAYAIAVDVMQRPSSFDPAVDSIVRVEMHRLRRNLESWNQDTANTSSHQLQIPTRSYRVELVGRASQRPQSIANRLSGRKGLAIILCLVALLVGVFFVRPYVQRAELCRSARPELALPDSIENLPASAASDLLSRLRGMFSYYPLVNVETGWGKRCSGVPHYRLTLQATGQKLTARLEAMDEGNLLTNIDFPMGGNLAGVGPDILAAQIAYRIAYDGGAIPIDAMRRNWGDRGSMEQYGCLMQAHQYFFTNAGSGAYQAARHCLIGQYEQATRADVPAMLAALEVESLSQPILRSYQTENFYERAIKRATELDPLNSELLMAMLRQVRFRPDGRRGDAQYLLELMGKAYPFEPNILNQSAITRCRFTQSYTKAYEDIYYSQLISMQKIDLPYALLYCNFAEGKSKENEKYNDIILSDNSPFIILFVLHNGMKLQNRRTIDLALMQLKLLGCDNRACLLEAAKEGAANPDIGAKLLEAVDRYFPG